MKKCKVDIANKDTNHSFMHFSSEEAKHANLKAKCAHTQEYKGNVQEKK